MKNKILLFFALCGALVACSKDDGGKKPTYGKVAKIDIVGAQYLYSTRTGGSTSGTGGSGGSGGASRATRAEDGTTEEKVYKITANGNTNEVIVTDENGNEIPICNVSFLPVTDNIVMFSFSYEGVDYDITYGTVTLGHHCYFVRKSDGSVFEVPDQFTWAFDQFITRPLIKDKFENIFSPSYTGPYSYNSDIYKINLGGDIKATKLASDMKSGGFGFMEFHYFFLADYLGNVIYQNDFDNYKVITPAGVTFRVDNIVTVYEYSNQNIFPLPKRENGGFLYRYREIGYYGYDYYVMEVNGDNEAVNLTPLSELQPSTDFDPVVLDDKIVFVPLYLSSQTLLRSGGDSQSSITILRGDLTIKTITDERLNDRGTGRKVGNHIYWVGQTAIYDFNVETEAITTLYTLNANIQYGNFSFADGLIMFNMTDRTREKRFRCEIRDGVYSETEITTSDSRNRQLREGELNPLAILFSPAAAT